MHSFFSNKRLIILLSGLVVLIALISYSLRTPNRASLPEQFVQDTVGWFQYAVSVPAQYAAGFFQNVSDMKNAYEENKHLKSQLEHYAQIAQENRELSERYQEMKKLLGINNDPNLSDYNKYPAMVIGRSFNSWSALLTVNKGRLNSVHTGMPVIDGKGALIGVVSKTGNFSSQVVMITDTQDVSQISAKIAGTAVYGMIDNYDAKTGRLSFEKIPINADVKKGQTVVTSGLSSMYSEGLIIGTVVSISTDQYGLTKTAQVKPSADFNSLDYVAVVERKAPSASSGR